MAQNVPVPLLASAARTAGIDTAVQPSYGAVGVMIILRVTAASGTGGLIPQFRLYDPISGAVRILWRIPKPVKTTGEFVYYHHPAADYRNTSLQYACPMHMPANWSVQMAVDDASSYTYSLSAILLGAS